ncbi:ATP-binding cassette domain-containing protein [Psychrobium sp. 1_MG-2023]|uniref:ATP-binding cassette domain-containing protein n=1 Tax=Psychrobium sp. 1_MG-2023 TaxID=3062624 RepID=UPI000C34BF02|nr:ATP-binding cassette domain-containing protein [Psychrobium sp. 1_MG-2023]MDP2562432.1 ATP-binding cassette domain-containing protein [Psychrobium sp. 1_MG-2023]PKF56160.1 peptide ABC transporter ATP-binding protein [Alteromonadales bacterium alter-6D02]
MLNTLLEVNNLTKSYRIGYRWLIPQYQRALGPVSFKLEEQQTLSVVGNAGSGKTTLARILVGAEQRTSGQILLEGEQLEVRNRQQRCSLIRMIFQDANTSLNPRMRIGNLLEEPLKFATDMPSKDREKEVYNKLRQVGLLPEHAHFYPHMISGGQKQRIAVARALMLDPHIIVADEALSVLDMSVRSQVINLLLKLQNEMGLSYIFVSHNINVVRHVSDQVMVLDQGKVIEFGDAEQVFNHPENDYTRKLLYNLGH